MFYCASIVSTDLAFVAFAFRAKLHLKAAVDSRAVQCLDSQTLVDLGLWTTQHNIAMHSENINFNIKQSPYMLRTIPKCAFLHNRTAPIISNTHYSLANPLVISQWQ